MTATNSSSTANSAAAANPTTYAIPPGKPELTITRVFNAPRDLVWKAMTDPALVPRWWGREGSPVVVDKMDVRVGGEWRFIDHAPDGSQVGFRGVYREITPPERIVQTFEYEGMPGHVSLETMTLEDHGAKTRFTVRSVFDSVEDRDGMVASGMEEGATETYNRLEALLQELQR